MVQETLTYPSADGTSTVHARVWLPEPARSAAPRGIVQVVHGMSEHSARYDPFAEALCAQGYLVCCNDHVGHGLTASHADDLGHIPLAGGADILLRDVDELRRRVVARVTERPGGRTVPYVLFGHSLGSFVVRVYLTRCAEGVAAAVICGTGQQAPALAWAGNALCHVLAAFRGEHYRSRLIHELVVGAYGRAIKGACTPYDWLSTDPAVVRAYQEDPRCGQVFTVGGYAAVTSLAALSQRRSLARCIPRDLPLLFIAGADDPVGAQGRGVRRAARQYRELGMTRVSDIVYPGMRHEILNEPGRTRVCRDVLAWLDAVASAGDDAA